MSMIVKSVRVHGSGMDTEVEIVLGDVGFGLNREPEQRLLPREAADCLARWLGGKGV